MAAVVVCLSNSGRPVSKSTMLSEAFKMRNGGCNFSQAFAAARSGALSRFSHIAYYTQLLPSLRFFPCYTKCPFSRLTLLYRSFKGAATIHIHNRQYHKKSTQYTITNVVLAKLDTKLGSAKNHISCIH